MLKALTREELHPYHFQTVQALQPVKEERQYEFSHRLLTLLNVDQNLAATVQWTDVPLYTREEVINYHNNHIWSLKYHNPKNKKMFPKMVFCERLGRNTKWSPECCVSFYAAVH